MTEWADISPFIFNHLQSIFCLTNSQRTFFKRRHLMKNLLKLVDNSNRILVLSTSFVNLFLLPNLSIFLRFLVSQLIFSLNHGASTKERWGDIVEQSVTQLLVASQTRKVCVINQSLILCCGSVRNCVVFVVILQLQYYITFLS